MMKKYFLFAAAALTLAACSNDESDNQLQNDNVIRFSSTVGTATRAGSNLLKGNFANGTEVKVKLTAADNSVTYDAVNYTVGDEGALTTDPVQYYPASGSNVSAYAYYPANASIEADGFQVATNQSADDDYETSDLMYASIPTLNKTSTNNLEFRHVLSKIVVTLAAGTGFDASELADVTIALNGVKYKGTFDPAAGTFTPADDTQTITLATAASTAPHAAVVVPQDMSGKEIAVTIGNGTPVAYSIPASTTFNPGTVYSYTITVAKTGISVTSSIAGWTSGGDAVEGNVTF